MQDLIDALLILRKYGNPQFPTHCEHDLLTICGIDPTGVSEEDKAELKNLGFFVGGQRGGDPDTFCSYRFGSA